MDPVANMLIAIKNGYMAQRLKVQVPFSKFKMEIAKLLEREKVVGKVAKEESKLSIELFYDKPRPKYLEIQKISKLGLRVYTKGKNIKKVKGGKGIFIISTPKGVMTGDEAKNKKVGGEVICRLWQ